MPLESFLNILRGSNVIGAILEAFQNVDGIGHEVSLSECNLSYQRSRSQKKPARESPNGFLYNGGSPDDVGKLATFPTSPSGRSNQALDGFSTFEVFDLLFAP